ncbi:TPM domain-containing protein [Enterococcus sp. DIV0756]|uniref:TPM domain-containing protein n=1 Tax=Enterococcus sp. DIV0756 TaxID=2774636 RepID=UPI003F269F89
MKRVLCFLSLVIFGLFWCGTVRGENIYVEDQANVLSSETKEEVYQYNQAYKRLKLRPQMAVVTLEELPEGQTIESYANEKFNQLGIGDKEHDSGVLYVLSVNDRKQRIEVGYGLEGDIPDALAMDLMTEEAKGYFREENYDAGVKLVVSNINQVLLGSKTIKDFEPGFFETHFAGKSPWDIIRNYALPVIIVLVILYVFLEPPIRKMAIYLNARREFANELKKDLKKDDPRFQRYSVRKMIHSKEPEVLIARGKIVKRYKRLKNKKPRYYHFYYAFGTLKLKDLFVKKKKEMKQYSVYYHHKDLWNKGGSRDDRYDRDSSSGGGDSFGGGSSGGGGASSDW